MARLNKTFDSDENSLDPPANSHAIPRSPLKNTRVTCLEKEQRRAITHGQESHNSLTEEGLQIPPLEPAKSITSDRSGRKTLRRQRPLTPLYVNLQDLPIQTDAARSEHGLGFLHGLKSNKPRFLISGSNMKTLVNQNNSASKLPQIGSSVLESRRATRDLWDCVLIDFTSETDDDIRGDFLQQTRREAYKPRGQKNPKMQQLLGTDSKITQKSILNFPSITDNNTPSNKRNLDISIADCASSKANTSPEYGDPKTVFAEEDDVFLGK